MTLLSANHYWRIAAAGICYVVFAIGAFIPGIYVSILAIAPMSAAQKQWRTRNAIQRLCRFYVNFMQFLGLMHYELQGEPKSQLRGHLIVSNHSTLIDALFVLAYVPNLCCVVKGALCSNPFTRIPVRLAGYISNDDSNLISLANEKLQGGENVLIFPEGTRNSYDTQLEFKRGAANIAIQAQCPILPLLICCQPRALQKGQHWYELPNIKSKFTIKFQTAKRLEQCIDTTLPRPLQYRRLTAWLREYYLKEVIKIVGAEPAL